MHHAHVSGSNPEQVRQVASHLLALWGVGALDRYVDPKVRLEIVSVAWDDLRAAPRYVDFSLSSPDGPVARLDVSRHLEIATRPEDKTPTEWLWADALPVLLPARLVEALRREFQERDAYRKRLARRAAKNGGQEVMDL